MFAAILNTSCPSEQIIAKKLIQRLVNNIGIFHWTLNCKSTFNQILQKQDALS